MVPLAEAQKLKQGDDLGTKMMTSVLNSECERTIRHYVAYSPFAPRFIPIPFADAIDDFTQPLLTSGFNQWEAPV